MGAMQARMLHGEVHTADDEDRPAGFTRAQEIRERCEIGERDRIEVPSV